MIVVFYFASPIMQSEVHRFEPKCSAVKQSFQSPNNATTCLGFVHKSRSVSYVGICVQVKRSIAPCELQGRGVVMKCVKHRRCVSMLEGICFLS